jgi:hypothetical protein
MGFNYVRTLTSIALQHACGLIRSYFSRHGLQCSLAHFLIEALKLLACCGDFLAASTVFRDECAMRLRQS